MGNLFSLENGRRCRMNRSLSAGEFFGISPTWFRLAMLLALLPGGVPGVLIYIILWIVIPPGELPVCNAAGRLSP